MKHKINDYHNHLLTELADEDRERRELITEFLAIPEIHKLLIKSVDKWAANSIATLPRLLRDYISTDAELSCFNLCIQALFRLHQKQAPKLKAPAQLISSPVDTPLFHADTLPINLVTQLCERLYHPNQIDLNRSMNNQHQLTFGRWLLLCALECNINRLSALNELAALPFDAWYFFEAVPAITAFLPNSHQRVWLRPMGALLLHHLNSSELPHLDSTKKMTGKNIAQKAINTYLEFAFADLSEALNKYPLTSILRDIGLLQQPAGLHQYWPNEHSLTDEQLVHLFTNTPVEITASSSRSITTLRLPYESDNHTAKGDNTKAKRHVNGTLRHYMTVNVKNDHRAASYQECLRQLKNCQQCPMNLALLMAISWIAYLFENGSPWTEKLAARSLLTYFSDVNQFIQTAFGTYDFRRLSTNNLNKQSQAAIDQISCSKRQLTCVRFLHFINRFNELPTIDIEQINLTHRDGRVRTNYLSPRQFDLICEKFKAGKGIFEQQITLFMQLCYYGCFREDDVLSLKVGDIDFECGLINITPDKKRKSLQSVRKFPLCMLSDDVLRQLITLYQQRLNITGKEALLFDEWPYHTLEQQFITFLRKETLDDTWVTHLLRHCGANNALLTFSLLTGLISYLPSAFEHPLFSKEKLTHIKAFFSALGTTFDLTFPVLDAIALLVGHAGPATTLGNYLHLVDYVIFQQSKTEYTVSKPELLHCVSANLKYGFNLAKKLSTPSKQTKKCVWLLKNETLRWVITKYNKVPNFYKAKVKPHLSTNMLTPDNNLCFSRFTQQLSLASQGLNDTQLAPWMMVFIEKTSELPSPLTLSTNQYIPWLKLSQHLDWRINDFTSIEVTALRQLRHKLKINMPINNIRELKRHLNALNAIDIDKRYPTTISGKDSVQLNSWKDMIDKTGRPCRITEGTSKSATAALRPYRLNWALWSILPEIIDLILAYLTFKESVFTRSMVK
tara:strand:- start:2046 stop:4925 length:2880 start_codon:yes stop_codon:yes gene_type:complete